MTSRASSLAAVLVVLTAAPLAACSSASTAAPGSPPASASAPASSPAAQAPPSAPASAGTSSSASAASAKACAELDAWQKKHGNSAAPPQAVFNDLINTPQPLSGDFTTWDFAVETSLPDAQADLLKVWTDCAKAEAAAIGG
jgi:hypothetical protein